MLAKEKRVTAPLDVLTGRSGGPPRGEFIEFRPGTSLVACYHVSVLIKSAILTDGCGSLGDVTLMRTRSGLALRDRFTPTNPQTQLQQFHRSSFTSYTTLWSQRTPEQKQAWETYAAAVPVLDRFGHFTFITGKQWFFKINLTRRNSNAGSFTTAPTILSRTELAPTGMIAGSQFFRCRPTFSHDDPWRNTTGAQLFLWDSGPQPLTVINYSGSYQHLGRLGGSSTSPPVSGTTDFNMQSATFGASHYFFRIMASMNDARTSYVQDIGPIRLP